METLTNDDSNLSRMSGDDSLSVTSPTVSTTSKRRSIPAPAVSADNVRSTSRRRTKTTRFDFDFLENEEQMYLQQALKISRKETCRKEFDIPLAPVFYPTLEEFKDTLVYINKIRPLAEPFGICKIVPPAEWSPPCQIDMNSPKRFATKLQQINTLQEGQGFDDGRHYTLDGYRKMAEKFQQTWREAHYGAGGEQGQGQEPSEEQLARDYWDMVETSNRTAAVEYGNDLDTHTFMSGFSRGGAKSETHAFTGWNLNNLPTADGSVLRYLQTPVNGVNVPWLYLGMLFASFCWHNEDNYCYSISYNHFGATKQWYGVAGINNVHFEAAMKESLLGSFREAPDLVHHLTTQMSPSRLIASGIPVYKAAQSAGSFIVTFPKAYHCGFSYGFNCGEAVNFATYDWLKTARESVERYRHFARESVFSYTRLLFTLWENRKGLNTADLKQLTSAIVEAADVELYGRVVLAARGVHGMEQTVVDSLPPNDFRTIDEKAMLFDDQRLCSVCKQACVFSCVVCACDQIKVTCLSDYGAQCNCNTDSKFLLAWTSAQALTAVRSQAKEYLTASS